MSTLNLEDESVATRSGSVMPTVIRTMFIVILCLGALTAAVFAGYYYAKYQGTSARLDDLQSDITVIKNQVSENTRQNRNSTDIESKIEELGTKIDDLGAELREIKDSTDSIERNVGSIESDVSSIQLKIGY